MQTRTTSRRRRASVPGSRQMNTGRQSGTGRIKSSQREWWVKKLDKEQLSEQSTACPGRRPLHQSAMLVVLLEFWLLLSYRATETGEEGRQQGKHRRQVKKKLRLPNVSFFNYEVLSNSFSNEAGHRTDFSSILYLSVSWMFLIYLRVASAGLSAFQVFARQENKHSTLSAAHRSVCTSTPHLRLQSSVGTAADTVATNGVVYSISIRRLIPDVWSHWPGCQIKAFVLKRSLLKKKKNATQFHKKKNRCGALSCLSCALWKQSVEGEVSKQAGAPPRRQLSRRASQRRLLTETETSYDTSTTRGEGGGRSPLSAEAATLSTETKSVPNPEAAQGRPKPKSKGHFFLLQGPYPLLHSVFPPRCCRRWAGQGAENCLQHWTMRGDASNQGVEQ